MTNSFTAANRAVEVTSEILDQSIAARSRDRSSPVPVPSFALVLKYSASPKSAISCWIRWSDTLMPPRSVRAATRKAGGPPSAAGWACRTSRPVQYPDQGRGLAFRVEQDEDQGCAVQVQLVNDLVTGLDGQVPEHDLPVVTGGFLARLADPESPSSRTLALP